MKPSITTPRILKWVAFALISLFGLGVLGVLFVAQIPIQLVGLLLLGWIPYLRDVLPRVAIDPEIFTHSIVALALATFGLHRILRWWALRQSGDTKPWRLAWTLKITAMVLLLFATSVAATGIAHQVGWLLRTKPLTHDASRSQQTKQLSNLKQVALGIRLYEQDHPGSLPFELEALVPDYLSDRHFLFSSLVTTDAPQRILYYKRSTGDPPDTIILAAPEPSSTGKRGVARLDSSAEIINEPDFQKEIRAQEERRLPSGR